MVDGASMQAMSANALLYAPGTPYASGFLSRDNGHQLYYERHGRLGGHPVLFLHGGPGSGCSERHRQLFDPHVFDVLLFDQRGCGRSRADHPLQANTSADLVADIEALRQHLSLPPCLVTGGSWGAGLALAYAAQHPQACTGLVLRGLFLGRASDLDWFFQTLKQALPEAWQALTQGLPAHQHTQVLEGLSQQLKGSQALEAALAWEAWENSVTARRAVPQRQLPHDSDAARHLLARYRLQAHYLTRQCFWPGTGLLGRLGPLAPCPIALLHGRLDWVCRPQASLDLRQVLPHSKIQWLDDTGHSPFEPAMAQALNQVLLHHAWHHDFKRWNNSP